MMVIKVQMNSSGQTLLQEASLWDSYALKACSQ